MELQYPNDCAPLLRERVGHRALPGNDGQKLWFVDGPIGEVASFEGRIDWNTIKRTSTAPKLMDVSTVQRQGWSAVTPTSVGLPKNM